MAAETETEVEQSDGEWLAEAASRVEMDPDDLTAKLPSEYERLSQRLGPRLAFIRFAEEHAIEVDRDPRAKAEPSCWACRLAAHVGAFGTAQDTTEDGWPL